MIQKCPICDKPHDSEKYDEGWYFLCCHYRLVWERNEEGELELNVVPEDCGT